MDYIAELFSIFNIDKNEVHLYERIAIVQATFEIPSDKIPPFEIIEKYIHSFPDRDDITIILSDDLDMNYCFHSGTISSLIEYNSAIEEFIEFSDKVNVELKITKRKSNNSFSIYDFKSFTDDLLKLSFTEVLEVFSRLLNQSSYLFFEIFNQDYFFKTKTLITN